MGACDGQGSASAIQETAFTAARDDYEYHVPKRWSKHFHPYRPHKYKSRNPGNSHDTKQDHPPADKGNEGITLVGVLPYLLWGGAAGFGLYKLSYNSSSDDKEVEGAVKGTSDKGGVVEEAGAVDAITTPVDGDTHQTATTSNAPATATTSNAPATATTVSLVPGTSIKTYKRAKGEIASKESDQYTQEMTEVSAEAKNRILAENKGGADERTYDVAREIMAINRARNKERGTLRSFRTLRNSSTETPTKSSSKS
eukprot:GHVO01017424.1.p1 GENE.GHVO01017424.1~~GHVO01017424.1.p1  ORF type:complete len:300 (+),score=30.32 GHVO01017424.1:138-902(+)